MSIQFYVKDNLGNLVGAQYLVTDGKNVTDPNWVAGGQSRVNDPRYQLYDAAGNLLSQQNVNGYLIVPADYDTNNAVALASQISADFANPNAVAGLAAAQTAMIDAYRQGGSHDLQRTYNGLTNTTFVPAFTSAASVDLGFVGGYTNLDRLGVTIGGGLYNAKNYAAQLLGGQVPPSIHIDGDWFNNPNNVRSINVGAFLGERALATANGTVNQTITMTYRSGDTTGFRQVTDLQPVDVTAKFVKLSDGSRVFQAMASDLPGQPFVVEMVNASNTVVYRMIFGAEGVYNVTLDTQGFATFSGGSTNVSIGRSSTGAVQMNIGGQIFTAPAGTDVSVGTGEVIAAPAAGGAGTKYIVNDSGAVTSSQAITIPLRTPSVVNAGTGMPVDFEQAIASPEGFRTGTFDNQNYTVKYDAATDSAYLLLADGRTVYLAAKPGSVADLPQPSDISPIDYSQVAQVFGSTLGRYLAGSSPVLQVASGAILSSVAMNMGQQIEAATHNGFYSTFNGELATATDSTKVWNDFGSDLSKMASSEAIGTVSTYLAAELGQSLGLQGFGAELFGAGAGGALSHVATNLLVTHFPAFSGIVSKSALSAAKSSAFAGVGNVLESSIIAFLATKLGSLVLQPNTQAAVVLSSVGAGIGAIGASTTGALGGIGGFGTGGVIGTAATSASAIFGQSISRAVALAFNTIPGLGIFVGFVLGAFIGNLFGHKAPKVPTANAAVSLQIPFAQYEVGSVTVQNGGNADLVSAMALTARDTLNGLIEQISGSVTPTFVANTVSPTQTYGHTGSQLYVQVNSVTTNVGSADEAVDKGVLAALPQTQIIGGDIYMKRTLAASPATTVTALVGDLQVAADYELYRKSHAVIDAALAEPWTSLSAADKAFYTANSSVMTRILAKADVALSSADQAFYSANAVQVDRIVSGLNLSQFAAGWLVTLQRVSELGLDAWRPSDFYGGLKGFIDSFRPQDHSVAYEDIKLSYSGGALTITDVPNGIGALSEGFFTLPSASVDGRAVTINNFLTSGVGYIGWSGVTGMGGDNFVDDSGASSGLTIDDIGSADGSSGGDDIAIGSAFADVMQGRTGRDWLDGGAGNDVMHGGQDDDVVLGGDGDDILTGDKGNDYLAGGAGNDSMTGGDGNDTLTGKAGNDTMVGDAGDDMFLVNADGGTTFDSMDGALGNDTISYEKFLDTAVAVDLRTTSYYGDSWTSIENLTGSAGGDTLTGDAGANVLRGLAGADLLVAGDGNDTLEGGAGADRLYGEGGVNTASYEGSTAGVTVSIATGYAAGGDADGDLLSQIQNLRGSNFSDLLEGDSGANLLQGLYGDDYVMATAGADVIDGAQGLDMVDFSNATSAVSLDLGSSLATAPANGVGYSGMAAGQTFISIEGVVGSRFADQLYGEAGDQAFVGGQGNDYLAGGAGSDTYVFGVGDGQDQVSDNNLDANVISLNNVSYDDLFFGSSGNPSTPQLDIRILATGEQISVLNNFQFDANRNVAKALNINGVGQVDIGQIDFGVGGTDGADSLHGTSAHNDWLTGYGGNDVLYGAFAGTGPTWEDKNNLVIAGKGADIIYTSIGDDQFVFERGDGFDDIFDDGGADTLVFGPTVASEDVIYEVSGQNLYIGLKDPSNPSLTASQVADTVFVSGGASEIVNDDTGAVSFGTGVVEYVNAGGTSIDLRKLDLNWSVTHTHTGGGGGVIPPIIFDLDGDGLNLSSALRPDVVVKGEDGQLSAVGWAGATEGMLAVDRNGDGKIDRMSEISFTQDKAGATSDLQGLSAWDSNGDGVLDAKDAKFGQLLIWVDTDQNGQSSKKELRTLAQAGIASIDLHGSPTGEDRGSTADNFVQNTLTATRSDGSAVQGYDVALATLRLGSTDYDGSTVVGDGIFGALLNDPVQVAQAAAHGRPLARGDVDKVAQADFSGRANARGIAMWANKPKAHPGQAGWEGADNLAGLTDSRAPKSDPVAAPPLPGFAAMTAPPSALGDAVMSVDDQPQGLRPAATVGGSEQSAQVLTGELDPLTAPFAPDATGPNVTVEDSSGWWQAATPQSLGFSQAPGASDELARLAPYQGVEAQGPAQDPPTGRSIDALRQQLLMSQAVAAFGGDAGGSAAVWTRFGTQSADQKLSSDPRFHLPSLERQAA